MATHPIARGPQKAVELATKQQRRAGVAAVWGGFFDRYKGPAAVLIQAHWRGYASRKLCVAQRRGHLLRHVRPTHPGARDTAARVVQRWWRGHCGRQIAWETRKAVILIQSCWKGYLTRRKWPALRRAWRNRNDAAVEIQRRVRGYLVRARHRGAPRSRLLAGYWHQRQSRAQATLRHYAAAIIQRYYRRWKAFKRAVWLRGDRERARVCAQREAAARCIQKAFRHHRHALAQAAGGAGEDIAPVTSWPGGAPRGSLPTLSRPTAAAHTKTLIDLTSPTPAVIPGAGGRRAVQPLVQEATPAAGYTTTQPAIEAASSSRSHRSLQQPLPGLRASASGEAAAVKGAPGRYQLPQPLHSAQVGNKLKPLANTAPTVGSRQPAQPRCLTRSQSVPEAHAPIAVRASLTSLTALSRSSSMKPHVSSPAQTHNLTPLRDMPGKAGKLVVQGSQGPAHPRLQSLGVDAVVVAKHSPGTQAPAKAFVPRCLSVNPEVPTQQRHNPRSGLVSVPRPLRVMDAEPQSGQAHTPSTLQHQDQSQVPAHNVIHAQVMSVRRSTLNLGGRSSG